LGCLVVLAPSSLRRLADMINHAFHRPNLMADAPTVV